MARIEGKRVPIPTGPGIYTKRGNGPGKDTLVFRVDDLKKSILIGYVCRDDPAQMIPNEKYRDLYKEEWKKQFGTEELRPMLLHFGMYAATNIISESTKLLQYMNNAFGEKPSKQLLDYAMYSILYQTDITSQYEYRMNDQVLFNNRVLSDSTYSNLFEKRIRESEILEFQKEWAVHCKEDLKIEEVWLCIDGSNEDCKSKGVEFAKKGKAKSGKNEKIVSFTYAVSTDGCPVTFKVYRGGLVDPTAMTDILGFLRECGIKVKGVILNRGYCTASTLEYLDDNHIGYVVMIKGMPIGLQKVTDLYKTKIRNDAQYLVRKTSLFAAQDTVQLFKDYKKTSYITIFYDIKNGAEQLDTFLKQVAKEADRLEAVIAKGDIPVITSDFADVLCLSEDGREVKYIQSGIQQHIDDTGIYGIAHSLKMAPELVHALYVLMNVSEKQYDFVRTQLGYGTDAHVHFGIGTKVKFTVGFISSIIRYELENAAQKVHMATTNYIRELDLIQMERINKSFFYNHAEKGTQIVLMKNLGKDENYLDELVKDVNIRFYDDAPQVKKKKPGPKPREKVVGKTEHTEEPKEKGKRGPRPGFKRGYFNADGSVRKKPGITPGTKRTEYNKDGSLREKPGPRPGSHHEKKNV